MTFLKQLAEHEAWDDPAKPAVEIGSTWVPQPKQELANEYAQQVDELLYGGAAGGGKTEWLIHYVAEQMEAHPNNRGVIFRRVYPSLARTVVPRARALLDAPGRARWNGTEHTLTFPNGSVLELSHLQYQDDVLKYYGAEYGIVAFEELTEFLQSQYEYMLGRLRAPAPGIRPHAVSTTNPGGPGHAWVKRRWIKPRPEDLPEDAPEPAPLEVWRPVSTPEQPNPGTRCFVPAKIEDNPALMRRDPRYLDRLTAALSNRGLRLALVEGDWDAVDNVEGALVTHDDLARGRRRSQDVPASRRRVLAVDTADGQQTGDEYGVAVVSLGVDGHVYIELTDGWSDPPRKLASRTIALAHGRACDAVVVERNHGGRWVPALLRVEDPYLNVKSVFASQGKIVRWEPVAALFAPQSDDEDAQPLAHLVGYQEQLESEMTTFTGAPGERSPNRLDAVVWAVVELLPQLSKSRIVMPQGTRAQASAVPGRLPISQRTVSRR